DGILEIAGGTTSGWNVEVMDNNGNFLWSFPAKRYTAGSYCWHSSPALADIVNSPYPEDTSLDGLELIIGNNPYHSVWCFDGDNTDEIDNGITLPRNKDGSSPLFNWYKGDLGVEGRDWDVLWVFENSQPIIASPAVGDIDNDGYKEVVIGSLDGYIYVINGTNGAEKWNFSTGGRVFSSAAIANIDTDPQLEVIVGSNDGFLYCLDGKNGMKQWNYSTAGAIYSSPAVGDINGDGKLDIVVGSLDGKIYCINRTGYELWNYSTNASVYSSPALAGSAAYRAADWPMFRHDCSRTGFFGPQEAGEWLYVFIGSDDGYLYKICGIDGSLIARFPTNGPIHTSPSIADVDGDVAIEIVFYDWGADTGKRDTFWCLEEPPGAMPTVDTVYVDNVAPIANVSVGQPNCEDDSAYCIIPATPITIGGNDLGCNGGVGVENVAYRIFWDGTWSDWEITSLDTDIYFNESCTHILEVRLSDYVDNVATYEYTFHVDGQAPVISKTVGDP
ncbi:MAG: PQQ-binding-like beta-propeller repeat protein, partial [Thermoplasmatota archaeon]